MTIELEIPDDIIRRVQARHLMAFKMFLQAVVNRRCVGALRYGEPDRRQKYLRRLALELRKYRDTGNYENLLNVAVYAYLESEGPQNQKFHFDPNAPSATREVLGGNIA